ncbi:MAG: TolC family outer membrane protein [Roseibium sp.]|uniref:TolC family outer membrane protein n=1 Tax=Roseibium sp. TaxID=1936156 RepID=UPI00262022E1|nr:TolC family outer membrane protein [Roseibium sp.]MCV0427668.1 TolC family outer membrane protein [Roseibium sp.]
MDFNPFSALFVTLLLPLFFTQSARAMSLEDAVSRAVSTNPQVLAAAANRRSVDYEFEQARGAYLPKLDLEATYGAQFIDRPNSLEVTNNREWRNARDATLVARQVFFDGFARANEVYRQSARIDGSAARVMERAELIGLDATETFLDVIRHHRILKAADVNIQEHVRLLNLVRTKVEGGSATESELRQAEERVAAVHAVRADVLRELGAAKARFENVIGIAPPALKSPRAPRKIPKSEASAIATARGNHPALRAGSADVDAATADYDKTQALFLPKVGLEGVASVGEDLDGTPGRNNEFAVRMTMSWNLFNGTIDANRRRQLGEKVTESKMELDQLRRTVDESVRRSWSDILTNDVRLKALKEQTVAADAVIVSYEKEYEAGLRDLLDLLIAQNSAFTSRVQLISSQTIAVFSRYRLLASTGELLASFGIAAPPESLAGDTEMPWFVGSKGLIEPLRKW